MAAPAGCSSQLPTDTEDLVAQARSSAWRWTRSCVLASLGPIPLLSAWGDSRPRDGWVDGIHGGWAPSMYHPASPWSGHRGWQALVGAMGTPCRAPRSPLPLGTPRHGACSLCGPCSQRRASPPRPPSPCSSQQWWPGQLGM